MINKGTKIIWFTGISGVGKTTLSNSFYKKFKKKFRIKRIDGDVFRKKNKTLNSFSKKNRSDFLNNLEQVIRSTK